MDPNTGEILAMSTKPSFDLNNVPRDNVEEMLNQLKQFDAVIFANERQGENNIVKELSKKNINKVAVVIGCEGGFSESEKQQLLQLNNIISITLGKRILKAETASIGALALTMNALGEI